MHIQEPLAREILTSFSVRCKAIIIDVECAKTREMSGIQLANTVPAQSKDSKFVQA